MAPLTRWPKEPIPELDEGRIFNFSPSNLPGIASDSPQTQYRAGHRILHRVFESGRSNVMYVRHPSQKGKVKDSTTPVTEHIALLLDPRMRLAFSMSVCTTTTDCQTKHTLQSPVFQSISITCVSINLNHLCFNQSQPRAHIVPSPSLSRATLLHFHVTHPLYSMMRTVSGVEPNAKPDKKAFPASQRPLLSASSGDTTL